MSARPRLLRAYEFLGLSSTALSNDEIASLRLPIFSCTRPSVFHADERFGCVSTATLASVSALSSFPPSSALRAAEMMSAGLLSSLSSSSVASGSASAIGLLTGGAMDGVVGVGSGMGAGGSATTLLIGVGFDFGRGTSSHAGAIATATATARMRVMLMDGWNRNLDVNIWESPFTPR